MVLIRKQLMRNNILRSSSDSYRAGRVDGMPLYSDNCLCCSFFFSSGYKKELSVQNRRGIWVMQIKQI
jgi:hypothetical protein